MPRAFVFSSHGSMPMIDDESFVMPESPDVSRKSASKNSASKKSASKKSAAQSAEPLPALPPPFHAPVFASTGAKIKKPDSFESPVDTFTTAKCGYPFCADLRCDAPYVGLVHNLSQLHLPPHVPKDTVREIIKQTMLGIRHDPRQVHALTKAENKIRCHKKGSPMTELFLFDPSHELPIVESVTMVDMETGEIQDAHSMFGLVEKHASISRPHTAVQFDDDGMAGLQYAKQRAEWDLHTLQGAHPFYVKMKKNHIETIDDTIAGVLKESKFEYSPELKALKAKHGGRVKLSDLLKIGKRNGLNPETDYVVVYACRVPDERVPSGAPTSPRNSSDSERSVGGGTRSKPTKQRCRTKTCKQRRH